MFEKLEKMELRYNELEKLLADSSIVSNPKLLEEYAREYSEIKETVNLFHNYKKINGEISTAEEMLLSTDDSAIKEELSQLKEEKENLEKKIKSSLSPKDPYDEKNIIMEIRAGTGGQEAALFAQELFRLYSKCAEKKGFKVELISMNSTGLGGIKEVIFSIAGKNTYKYFKYEGGVHRVQRIPQTESSGRIHTSTVTVAVLPEADEIDLKISPDDLRIDTFCSSGKGGQSVNTTYSAVRITHIPTGVVVQCQDERSQLRNREKALKVLRSRILNLERKKQQELISENRKSQVGSAERSEKIRTYNFPQDRITDHRIGLTLHNIKEVLDGELDELVDKLTNGIGNENP